MFTTIIVLIVFVAVVLVLVVLAQNSKGGGLTSQFGGSGTSQLMGVKKTGDLLEKLTWGLAVALISLTLSTKFLITESRQGEFVSPNIESAQEKTIAPNLDLNTDESNADDAVLEVEETEGEN
ncbi:preprotein translocase subunit SecG [Reichenbachiella carrageenanivorans]|uniref:Protein-export membrane protein SecG n=1 Tax=Reichenbachiella carrageenanivorans TaxID=2979869 RepID=A0ABY6CW63_9BACT|nr:preprotein translocase subunit SecG [Reichenbachiella carrageenanivorans]UXX78147.1 preprotein translocase subunit SecG [Reichenbachiella carrageenanivorans]